MKMANIESELKAQVLSVVSDIENSQMDACDFLGYEHEALDVQYVINSDRSYRGAYILVAFGGPNIWINTVHGTVQGFWGNESVELSYEDSMGLDDFMADMYSAI
jgi:hypothetical protein